VHGEGLQNITQWSCALEGTTEVQHSVHVHGEGLQNITQWPCALEGTTEVQHSGHVHGEGLQNITQWSCALEGTANFICKRMVLHHSSDLVFSKADFKQYINDPVCVHLVFSFCTCLTHLSWAENVVRTGEARNAR